MAEVGEVCTASVYGVVANIPHEYHACDLRNYFSQFIESGGFECFHFRHRPENRNPDKLEDSLDSCQLWSQTGKTKPKTCCCIVNLKAPKLAQLIRMYHGKHWLDKKGESMRSLCLVSGINMGQSHHIEDLDGGPKEYRTRGEQKLPSDRVSFTSDDLKTLTELRPPDVMPNGNVGTTTTFFLGLIQSCKLPTTVIRKLGLVFPKTRSNRRYGNVPLEYDGEIHEGTSEWDIVTTGRGHDIESGDVEEGSPKPAIESNHSNKDCRQSVKSKSKKDNKTASKDTDKNLHLPNPNDSQQPTCVKDSLHGKKTIYKKKKQRHEHWDDDIERVNKINSDSEEDADDCEEWERHEALHDDPTNVERNKERLFEEEMEVQWEKGGSGLVFYTDAQYWDQQEGDFDEKTADDWDVDMSAYYEPNGGDKDARDFVIMRQDQRRRKGLEATDRFTAGIGKFEKHTKGIGRKVLEKQGWSEGQGLGSWTEGMAQALDNDGQKPTDRTGFGYRGEKLQRFQPYSSRKPRVDRPIIISTVFDDPKETDPDEPLLRRSEPHTIKYRSGVNFQKASNDQDS